MSPVQAHLTMLLMTGQSVKDIAATLGIAHDSARQYLKRIYRKTGTRRQTDLVRIASQALTISDKQYVEGAPRKEKIVTDEVTRRSKPTPPR